MLGQPDELKHNNPAYAMLDESELRGAARGVADVAARNAIPSTKRKQYAIVSYAVDGAAVTKRYKLSDLSDAAWQNEANWEELGGGGEGISPEQAASIEVNSEKVGITPEQAAAILTNSEKVGITPEQAAAIVSNSAKVSADPAMNAYATLDNTNEQTVNTAIHKNALCNVDLLADTTILLSNLTTPCTGVIDIAVQSTDQRAITIIAEDDSTVAIPVRTPEDSIPLTIAGSSLSIAYKFNGVWVDVNFLTYK